MKPLNKKTTLGMAALAIVFGILFCVLRTGFVSVLFTIIGVLILVAGILCIFNLDIIGSVVGIAIGLLFIVFAWALTDALFIMTGVVLCLSGIYGIVLASKTKQTKGIVFAILSMILGVLFFFTNIADWIFFIIGALFIIGGIAALISALIKSDKKKVKEVDVKEVK